MAGPVSAYLLDTNVILRLYHPHSPEFPFIRKAISSLHNTNVGLYYFSQNLIEFWSVSTRPISQNGYGLSPAETDQIAKQIEKAFILLPEVTTIHDEWRRLVVDYGVSGAKVLDARLVAGMIAHGIRHILTLDENDFARYTEVVAVSPKNIS